MSNAEFTEALAFRGRVRRSVRYSGVLCGRATWKDGVPIFATQGASAFRRWLETTGVANITNVNKAIQPASPWFFAYGVSSADALA